jgi:hypothetical protein
MQEVLPNVFFLVALVSYVVLLGAIIWGFYLAYLATRALQKYLRS